MRSALRWAGIRCRLSPVMSCASHISSSGARLSGWQGRSTLSVRSGLFVQRAGSPFARRAAVDTESNTPFAKSGFFSLRVFRRGVIRHSAQRAFRRRRRRHFAHTLPYMLPACAACAGGPPPGSVTFPPSLPPSFLRKPEAGSPHAPLHVAAMRDTGTP